MGSNIIKDIKKVVNKAINYASFGNYGTNSADNVYTNRIGVYWRNYGTMRETLKRKIGEDAYLKNGYYTIQDRGHNLGQRVSIKYGYSPFALPSFISDEIRDSYSDYRDYLAHTYGYSSFFDSSDPFVQFTLDSKVYAYRGVNADELVNDFQEDTTLGKTNAYCLYRLLEAKNVYNINRPFKSVTVVPNVWAKSEEDLKNASPILYDYIDHDNLGLVSDFDLGIHYYDTFEEAKNAINNSYSLNLLPNDDALGSLDENLKPVQLLKQKLGNNTIVNNYFDEIGIRFSKDNILGRINIDTSDLNSARKNGQINGYSENGSELYSASHNLHLNTSNSLSSSANDLMKKTAKLFDENKINTMIARYSDITNNEQSEIQSAVSKEYGISRGRNLLKLNKTTSHGYTNPYCRVWTNHNQYKRFSDLIRPTNAGEVMKPTKLAQNDAYAQYRTEYGSERLEKNTVLDYNTGLVNITPSKSDNVSVKNCMFSIENLAWKGSHNTDGVLDEDQKGQFGGRVMWFPPYNLKFTEDVGVDWAESEFIGRGEKIYTYKNTERGGTLNFTLLIDHPSIINSWSHKNKPFGDPNITDDMYNAPEAGKQSAEQGLLRFFAGCHEIKKVVEPPRYKKYEWKEEVKKKVTKSFSFAVFFPNNYSGVDDEMTDAIRYLVNGVGTQYGSTSLNSNNLTPITLDMAQHQVNGENVNLGYEKFAQDYGISMGGTMAEVTNLWKTPAYNNKIYLKPITNEKAKTKWYYRIDNAYTHEILKPPSYADIQSYGLNGADGYQKAQKAFGMKGDVFSFMDVYVALHNAENKGYARDSRDNKHKCYDDGNVKAIKKILKEHKISKISTMGYANSQGHQTNNVTLSKNRGRLIYKWLTAFTPFKNVPHQENSKVQTVNTENVNVDIAKLYRACKVTIYYEVEEIEYVSKSRNELVDKNGNYINKLLNGGSYNVANESSNNNNQDVNNDVIMTTFDKSSTRYGNEYEFFSKLKSNDTVLHSRIIDKVKYFDPAYHSLTPEGFNSRLTFLHQCTRQGSTIGASDSSLSSTANNMSFGRPPICVLRIGDFYYTKIIIKSIQITYDNNGISWDTNPEGIGVMPMWADISITFKFIGGSDMTGPVSRLQNAVSFNYYANTSVYDNRAELVEYDENGKLDNFIPFVPK